VDSSSALPVEAELTAGDENHRTEARDGTGVARLTAGHAAHAKDPGSRSSILRSENMSQGSQRGMKMTNPFREARTGGAKRRRCKKEYSGVTPLSEAHAAHAKVRPQARPFFS